MQTVQAEDLLDSTATLATQVETLLEVVLAETCHKVARALSAGVLTTQVDARLAEVDALALQAVSRVAAAGVLTVQVDALLVTRDDRTDQELADDVLRVADVAQVLARSALTGATT